MQSVFCKPKITVISLVWHCHLCLTRQFRLVAAVGFVGAVVFAVPFADVEVSPWIAELLGSWLAHWWIIMVSLLVWCLWTRPSTTSQIYGMELVQLWNLRWGLWPTPAAGNNGPSLCVSLCYIISTLSVSTCFFQMVWKIKEEMKHSKINKEGTWSIFKNL